MVVSLLFVVSLLVLLSLFGSFGVMGLFVFAVALLIMVGGFAMKKYIDKKTLHDRQEEHPQFFKWAEEYYDAFFADDKEKMAELRKKIHDYVEKHGIEDWAEDW